MCNTIQQQKDTSTGLSIWGCYYYFITYCKMHILYTWMQLMCLTTQQHNHILFLTVFNAFISPSYALWFYLWIKLVSFALLHAHTHTHTLWSEGWFVQLKGNFPVYCCRRVPFLYLAIKWLFLSSSNFSEALLDLPFGGGKPAHSTLLFSSLPLLKWVSNPSLFVVFWSLHSQVTKSFHRSGCQTSVNLCKPLNKG